MAVTSTRVSKVKETLLKYPDMPAGDVARLTACTVAEVKDIKAGKYDSLLVKKVETKVSPDAGSLRVADELIATRTLIAEIADDTTLDNLYQLGEDILKMMSIIAYAFVNYYDPKHANSSATAAEFRQQIKNLMREH